MAPSSAAAAAVARILAIAFGFVTAATRVSSPWYTKRSTAPGSWSSICRAAQGAAVALALAMGVLVRTGATSTVVVCRPAHASCREASARSSVRAHTCTSGPPARSGAGVVSPSPSRDRYAAHSASAAVSSGVPEPRRRKFSVSVYTCEALVVQVTLYVKQRDAGLALGVHRHVLPP